MNHAASHRCVERATDCDCPICGEYMFTSSAAVVAMRCGHYIHRTCYDQYMRISYKCPICHRSAVKMELQWRKLEDAIASQPMPEQYRNTKAWTICNDCMARTCTTYHWLGNKCLRCDSYNTNETSLVDTEQSVAPASPMFSFDQSAQQEYQQDIDRRLVGRADIQTERDFPVIDASPIANPVRPSLPLRRSVSFSEPEARRSSFNRRSLLRRQVQRLSDSQDSKDNSSSTALRQASDEVYHNRPPHLQVNGESGSDTTDDESNDSMSFWGESLSPTSFVPTGWTSPRLFGTSPPQTEDEQTEVSSQAGSGSGWPLNPSTWRLGSPLFMSSRSGGNDDDIVEEIDDGSGSGWPINPSQWGLGSSRIFNFGMDHHKSDDIQKEDEQEGVIREASPGVGWFPHLPNIPNVRPDIQGFLARRLHEQQRSVVEAAQDEGSGAHLGSGLGAGWFPNLSNIPHVTPGMPGFLTRRLSEWREESATVATEAKTEDGQIGKQDLHGLEGRNCGEEDDGELDEESGSDMEEAENQGVADEEEGEDEMDLIGHR